MGDLTAMNHVTGGLGMEVVINEMIHAYIEQE